MEKPVKLFDCVIVAARHRGIYLANHLSKIYKNIMYLDLSSCQPPVSKADAEGPFGFFMNQEMDTFQREWWKAVWTPSTSGFSVLSDDIFLHFKEFFLQPIYQKRTDYQVLQNYLNSSRISSTKFKDNWLTYLTHLHSSIELPLPLNAKKIPAPTLRPDDEFGLVSFHLETQKLLNQNILYKKFHTFDYQIDYKNQNFIFLNSSNFLLQTKRVIWMLTPFETMQLHTPLYSYLFKKEVLPTYYWHMFSFDFDFEKYPFPLHFVCVSPHHLPWDYERFMCVKRDLEYENRLHVWVKLPWLPQSNKSKNFNFLKLAQNIQDTLQQKFPGFQCQYRLTDHDSYPVSFPVYEHKHLNKINIHPKPDLYHAWDIHDMSWNGWARKEAQILKHFFNNHQR